MGNPSLGYEDKTERLKAEIAKIQLNEEISLFLQKKEY